MTHSTRIDLEDEMKKAGLPIHTPTPEEQEKLDTALTWLVVNAPFFADLMYRKLTVKLTLVVPIAATDGFNIFINPEPFFKLTLREQVFVLAHEILHYVYGDNFMMHIWQRAGEVTVRPGVTLPYNSELMNIAEDLRINAMLKESKVGDFNKDWLYDPRLSEKGFENSLEIYEQLWKQGGGGDGRSKPGKGKPGGGPGGKPNGGQTRFDEHLAPGEGSGKDPDVVAGRANEAERAVAVAQAAQAAEAMGKMPAGLKRLVGDILEPKVDWKDKIRATLFRRLFGDGYDWTMPDRRMIVRDRIDKAFQPIYFARNTDHGCGELVIGVDTSGSIGPKQVERFFSEMAGIVESVNPSRLVVLWCDADIARMDDLEEVSDLTSLKVTIDKEGVPGGGGTDFRPVFKHIEKLGLEPECLVYFTDTMGTFPDKPPSYPVIWGNIYPRGSVPWGDMVNVEV
jgi:predicted metal-dependent peptidase